MHQDKQQVTHDFVDEGVDVPAATGRAMRVQMLGGSGVGKTCFIAGLSLLAEQSAGHSFVFPTDAATKAKFDLLRDTLQRATWPEKTSIADFLRFAVVRGRNRIDVQLSDFAGESFLDAMQRGNETAAARQIQDLVTEADLLMILLDGDTVDRVDAGGTLAAFSSAPLIQSVFERISNSNGNIVDIAVVLTKSDLCVDHPMRTAADVQDIVKSRAPDIHRFLSQQSVAVTWMPLTICGYNHEPKRSLPPYSQLAPDGYEDLFGILYRRQNRPRNRWLKLVGMVALLIAAACLAWSGVRRQRLEDQRGIIENSTGPRGLPSEVEPENEDALRRWYAKELQDTKQKIDQAGNIDSVDHLLTTFDSLPDAHKKVIAGELRDLRRHAEQRKEEVLYTEARTCLEVPTGDCVSKIIEYLNRYSKGVHAEEMKQELKKIGDAKYLLARDNVKSIPLSSPASLEKKKKAIVEFLKDHQDKLAPQELQAIQLARDLASRFLESRQYHCKLVRTRGLDTPRDHGVEIRRDDKELVTFDDSGEVIEKNWNRDFTLTWNAGISLQLVLHNYESWNQPIAFFENKTPVAIVLFAGEQIPARYQVNNGYFGDDFSKLRPPVTIKLTCEELTEKDLAAISDYLLPGDKW